MTEPTQTKTKTKQPTYRNVWCAYITDGPPDYVLFGSELAALRYAASRGMNCQSVTYGVPFSEQLKLD